MKTTLVSIVSEQTIPNILFIKQMPPANRYIFITTQKMEEKGISDNIIRVCELPLHKTSKIPVLENSFVNINNRLAELNLSNTNEQYWVNITGGTKPMSIVVYQFFCNLNSQIYYLPIGSPSFINCRPDETEKALIHITQHLALENYLLGYGIQISNPAQINTLLTDPTFTQIIYEKGLLNTSEINQLSEFVANKYKTDLHSIGTIYFDKLPDSLIALPNFLHYTLQFPLQTKNCLSANEIKYLLGGWFTEYAYSYIRDKYNLNDNQIGINITISRKGITNHLAIVYVHNNSLHLIECISKPNKKNIENTTYKLSGIKHPKEFGLQSKGAILLLGNYRDRKGNIRNEASERARLNDISIYDSANLIEL